MKCSECGLDFLPIDDEEDVCPDCQLRCEENPERDYLLRCARCGRCIPEADYFGAGSLCERCVDWYEMDHGEEDLS